MPERGGSTRTSAVWAAAYNRVCRTRNATTDDEDGRHCCNMAVATALRLSARLRQLSPPPQTNMVNFLLTDAPGRAGPGRAGGPTTTRIRQPVRFIERLAIKSRIDTSRRRTGLHGLRVWQHAATYTQCRGNYFISGEQEQTKTYIILKTSKLYYKQRFTCF